MKKYISLIIIGLIAISIWVPLWILFTGSFMGVSELNSNLSPVLSESKGMATWTLIPLYPTLKPYVELLFDSPQFFHMFWNSWYLVIPILLGQLIVGTLAAWGFAKYNFKFKKFLFTIYICLMLMPFQVTMVPSYLVLDKLKILDTRASIILPAIFSTFPVFIMYRFFKQIQTSMLEAASIDGANEFKIFYYIGLPLGKSGIISVFVLDFLEYWNLIEQPLTFLHNKSLWPLSLYLPNIVVDKAGVSLAASVIMLIPALLIFFYGQDYLEQGIQAVGIKE